jgi:hypothetical protein
MMDTEMTETIENGDLFVLGGTSFLVVSRDGDSVNLTGIRRLERNSSDLRNRERLRLRLRIDPDTKKFFVHHKKKVFRHVRQNDPEYDDLKPRDDIAPIQRPFDARKCVKIGDKFESNGRGLSMKTGPVVKVTKCFVTIAGYDAGRYKVSRGPQIHYCKLIWSLCR